MELVRINEVELDIDSSQIVCTSKGSKIKKTNFFDESGIRMLSKVATYIIGKWKYSDFLENLKKEQEGNRENEITSINKMKKKISNLVITYIKMNKSVKHAKTLKFYRQKDTLFMDVLKAEQILTQTDDGLLIDGRNAELVFAKADAVEDHLYFQSYFQKYAKK